MVKSLITIVIAFLFSAWTHGTSVPSSVTALVADPNSYVVDANGNYLVINNRFVDGSSRNIVCNGASLMGIVVPGPLTFNLCTGVKNWLAANRGLTVTYKAFSMPGYAFNYNYRADGGSRPWWGTINEFTPSQVDTELRSGVTNILIVEGGATNGLYVQLGNHSAATEFADFQTWWNARIVAGWLPQNIIFVTVLPRQDGQGDFYARAAAFNSLVKNFCMSNGCLVADAAADSTIGCDGCEDNATVYHPDKIHFVDAGQVIYSAIVAAVVP